MRYELKQNQGIPTPLLALMAIATGLSVANCYYNQPLLGSMARAFNVTDFSASIVATLTQMDIWQDFCLSFHLVTCCQERNLYWQTTLFRHLHCFQ